MTAESQTPGTIPPIPVWLYWVFMGLTAAIPVLLVAGVVPSPYDAFLAAFNAFLAVMTGTSRPAPAAERALIAAAKRKTEPPPTA